VFIKAELILSHLVRKKRNILLSYLKIEKLSKKERTFFSKELLLFFRKKKNCFFNGKKRNIFSQKQQLRYLFHFLVG
jgi:hypothetical protein